MTATEDQGLRQIPLHAADVRADIVEGELLLYHPEQTMAVYMNAPGAVIWGLCDGQRTVADIIALITQSYSVAQSDVVGDVLRTITELYQKKLLVQRFVN
jgi:Coenzyme PQQ synthesis protein D (PqqD)